MFSKILHPAIMQVIADGSVEKAEDALLYVPVFLREFAKVSEKVETGIHSK